MPGRAGLSEPGSRLSSMRGRRPAPRVAAAPKTPLAIFDGDCGFCRFWIGRWKSLTQDRVDYAPYQEVSRRFPEIQPETFARAMQLVEPSGEVLEGAHAVFAVMALRPRGGFPLKLYRNLPGFAWISELSYRFVAGHRRLASWVTRALWGNNPHKPAYGLASSLFLRLLGLCYLAAFLSLWVQIDGLVGSRGILPVAQFLNWAHGRVGGEAYRLLPTLCWLDSGDRFLHVLCAGGTLASISLIAGLAPSVCLVAAWVFYLSLSVAGQVFLEFQWDLLLLETGFLAILFAPRSWRLRGAFEPPTAHLWLLRWLLFRLMFSSGFVKLASGDSTWRHLTALTFHYETQPLPPWTAWFIQQLPASFQKASCLGMFAVELVVPFLFFCPRRLRLLACGALVAFQLSIAGTGNYAFFNLLTIALCVLLVDDEAFPRKLRERWSGRLAGARWPNWLRMPVAAAVLLGSLIEFSATLGHTGAWPGVVLRLARAVSPYRSINTYGLFAVMTTSRPEIVVEGSEDGRVWQAYEFRWKPGDPSGRPRFVAPHQPRLDWQMWFAALGSYQENPWFISFLARLLQGSPEVLDLLEKNPFPDHPPRFIRAVVYDYHFTDAETRRRTGAWWRREARGLYCPVLSREMLR